MRNRLKLKATFGTKNSKNSPKSPTDGPEDSGLRSKLVSAPSLNNISIASPGEDFRSSVILPDLSRRFSFLARTESPDALKKQLDQLREGEANNSLTVEEEEIILEELRQLREAKARKRQRPIPPSSFGYNPHSGHPLRSRSNETDHHNSSFFGGHNSDHDNFRRAKKSGSSRSLASQASGDIAGRPDHARRPSDVNQTVAPPLDSSLGQSSGTTGIVNSSSLSSLASETSSQFEDSSPSLSSPPTTSRSSKRRSLFDLLSHDQLRRISNTLARIDESNGSQVFKEEEKPADMPVLSGKESEFQSVTTFPTSSIVNTQNGESGLFKKGEGKHKRSASQVTADRVQGYIPGMPRPVGTKSPSAASSRIGTPLVSSQDTASISRDSSPLLGAPPYPSPFGHIRKSSLTSSQLTSSFVPPLSEDLDEFNTLRSSESDRFQDSERRSGDRENELFHSAKSYASSSKDSTYLVPPSYPDSSSKHLSGNTAEHLMTDDENDDYGDIDRFMDAPRRQTTSLSINSRASSISGLHEPTLSASSSSKQAYGSHLGGPGRSLFLDHSTASSSRNLNNAPRGVSHTNDRSISSATAIHGHERFSAVSPVEDNTAESRYSRAPFQVGWNYPTSNAPIQHQASDHRLQTPSSPSKVIQDPLLVSDRSSYQGSMLEELDSLEKVLENALVKKESLGESNRRSLALEDLQPLVSQDGIDQVVLMKMLSPLTKRDIRLVHQRLMQSDNSSDQLVASEISNLKGTADTGLSVQDEHDVQKPVISDSKTKSNQHHPAKQPEKPSVIPSLPAASLGQEISETSTPSASEKIIAKYHAQSGSIKPEKGIASKEDLSQVASVKQGRSSSPSGTGLSPQLDYSVNMHEPGFADNFRAKVEAATQSLKNNSISSRPTRSKSLKGKGKVPISNPQFVSTTANVMSKPIPGASPTSSMPSSPANSPILPSSATFKNGSGLGSKIGSKIKRGKSGDGSKSIDFSPRQPGNPWANDSPSFTSPPAVPPLPSSPLLNNTTSSSSPHDPSSPSLANGTTSPQPQFSAGQAPKPRKSLRNLLRSKKSSEPRSGPSTPVPTPVNDSFSPPSIPHTPPIPSKIQSTSPPEQASHPRKEVIYDPIPEPPSGLARESSFSSNRSIDKDQNLKKISDDESARAMEVLFDAAQKLGIDSADVSQMLQRSNSQMSSRKSHYSSRSDDYKEGLPTVARVPSTRKGSTMIETMLEEPMEASDIPPMNHLRAPRTQQGDLGRSNSILRRTIIMPDDNRPSSVLGRPGNKTSHRSQHSGSSLLHRSPARSQLNVYSFENERKSFASSQGHGRSPSMNSQTNQFSDSRPALKKSGSSAEDSLYDLYDGEGDAKPDHPDRQQPGLIASSNAIEVLEMSNGDVLYSVLQNLRDVQEIDDIDWDMRSEVSASDLSRMSIDEPVQFTFKDRDPLADQRRSTHRIRAPRPETKIFYSSSRQMAELIDRIARDHDQGVLQFTPSPVVSPITPTFVSTGSHAPLSLPKRSPSINRQFLAARVSDAPSFTPSQTSSLTSMDTKLDRLMHSLEGSN